MWQRQETILAACGIAVPDGWASRAAGG